MKICRVFFIYHSETLIALVKLPSKKQLVFEYFSCIWSDWRVVSIEQQTWIFLARGFFYFAEVRKPLHYHPNIWTSLCIKSFRVLQSNSSIWCSIFRDNRDFTASTRFRDVHLNESLSNISQTSEANLLSTTIAVYNVSQPRKVNRFDDHVWKRTFPLTKCGWWNFVLMMSDSYSFFLKIFRRLNHIECTKIKRTRCKFDSDWFSVACTWLCFYIE